MCGDGGADALCLLEVGAGERLLIFPTLFPEHTGGGPDEGLERVSLYYDFSGAIDNIYASLAARFAIGGRFGRVRLWKDRAEFDNGRGRCALRRIDRPGGWSHMDLVFSEQRSREDQALFTVFVEEHLLPILRVLQSSRAVIARRDDEFPVAAEGCWASSRSSSATSRS